MGLSIGRCARISIVGVLVTTLVSGCGDGPHPMEPDPHGDGPHAEPDAPAASLTPWSTTSLSLLAEGLLVSPLGLDFADAQVGATSPAQAVEVRNIGADPVVLEGSGGETSDGFARSDDCEGATLEPGASCFMSFTFSPEAPGDAEITVEGSWNDHAYEIVLRGRGIGPRFRITPTGLDFGRVPVGGSLQQSVDVVNIGTDPVEISMAGGAAGPFGGVQDCQGRTLEPGEGCRITYTFSPTTAGVVEATTSGNVNGQPFAFSLRGEGATPSFRITPTGLDFGEVVVGSSLQQSVEVVNLGPEPVAISMVGGAAGPFGGVQNCQGFTLDPGESCQITYTFSPTDPGEVEAATSGNVNGQPFAFSLRGVGIATEGDRTAPYRISPTALDFGELQVGGSLQQSVDVVNVSGEPIEVSMAGGAAGPFGGVQDCQGRTLDPGEGCRITYTFSPTTPGVVEATTSGNVNGQSFTFSLRGKGVGPRFRITPTALDFGEVAVGGSLQQSVDVVNIGTDPVEISMAGGAAGPFGGVQNCQGFTLDPGEGCRITYTFSPTEPGEVEATTSGNVNGQSFAFSLRGEGVGPRFRITPFIFDFGPVPVGESEQRSVDVVNIGPAPVEISMAGGAAGPFGGVQNCQGFTLDPGEDCQITYTFGPTEGGEVTATTSGNVNGQTFAFAMRGLGLDLPGHVFGGFLAPAEARPLYAAGSVALIRFTILDADEQPLSDDEAGSLADDCGVTVRIDGVPGPPTCAGYRAGPGLFEALLRIPDSLAPGVYVVIARAVEGGLVLVQGMLDVEVR
jgi:hypothetical protein